MKESQTFLSLIVGAGAVENAWNPVVRALQPYYEYELDGESANSIFARIVYLLRWFASLDNDFSREQLKLHLDFANEIKKKIETELQLAQDRKEIKVREQFQEIIEKFLFIPNNQSFVVSTNWDTVIDQAINMIGQSDYPKKGSDIRTLHIHGSIKNSDSFYLPTEVTRELYRTPEEDEEIGNIHGTIMRALEDSNVSIIYGLSLSPLDAELCQTLAAGWDSNNLRKIIIIDPDHLTISKRVKSLLRKPRAIKIVGYDHRNLDKEIDHSEK